MRGFSEKTCAKMLDHYDEHQRTSPEYKNLINHYNQNLFEPL